MAEARTLLTRTLFTGPSRENLQLYIVDPVAMRDYRAKLGDLLTLIDKAWVGLGNVDNTADMDKPVSNAVQAALDAKPDLDVLVTKQQFDEFVADFSSYLTIDQINDIIANLQATVEARPERAEVEQMIANALSTFQIALNNFNSRITALEANTSQYVLVSTFNSVISGINSQLTLVNSNLNDFVDQTSSALSVVDQRLSALETGIGGIGSCNVSIGPNVW